MNLSEDAAADAADKGSSVQVEADAKLRKEWEKASTSEIIAWVLEYDDQANRRRAASPNTSRDHILNLVITQQHVYPLPNSRTARKQLTNCLERMVRVLPELAEVDENDSRDAPPAPAPHSQPLARLASAMPRASPLVDRRREMEREARADKSLARQWESSMSDDEQPSHHAVRFSLPQTVPLAHATSVTVPDQCLTCAEPRPASAVTKSWKCRCGLRGDLPTDSPQNNFLAIQARLVLTSSSSSASSSAPAAAAGQRPDTDTAASRLDKEFDRIARSEPDTYPLFDQRSGSESEAAALVAAALNATRSVLGASRYKPASKSLINLIQKGKLRHIGHAMPKLAVTPSAFNAEDVEIGFTVDSRGGFKTVAKEGIEPPAVPSLSMWATTLHAVILPALSAQPKAQHEWTMLSMTMEALERQDGWTFAREYCDLLLQSRIPQQLGFGKVDDDVLRDLRSKSSRHIPAHSSHSEAGNRRASTTPRPQQMPSVSRGLASQAERSEQLCNDFNAGRCTRGQACRYRHACRTCGQQHPDCASTRRPTSSSVITETAAAKSAQISGSKA